MCLQVTDNFFFFFVIDEDTQNKISISILYLIVPEQNDTK